MILCSGVQHVQCVQWLYSAWDRCLSQLGTTNLCRSLQRSLQRDQQLLCDGFRMTLTIKKTVTLTCDSNDQSVGYFEWSVRGLNRGCWAMWSDLKTSNTMLYTSLSCENLTGIPEYDFRGHGGHMPVHHARFSEWPLVSVGPGPLVSRRPLYRPKKSSKGMFKRRRIIDPYGGHFER